MSIIFKPTGTLDVSTSPPDLPDDGLSRCKNLRVDRTGVLQTRDGSSKVNASALAQTGIHRIVVQGNSRYTFAGTVIYEDEVSIRTDLTNAAWTAILYNSYSSTTQNIFAMNGTESVRIEGSVAYVMGLYNPGTVPIISAGPAGHLTGVYNVKYTFVRKEGSVIVAESDPGGIAAESVTLASQMLRIRVYASDQSQVTHIRIYRTAAGGKTYFLDQDIAVASYDYGYMYDWESTGVYIAGTGFNFTTEDSTNKRVATASWELDYTDSGEANDETPCRSYHAYSDDAIEIYSDTIDGNLGTSASTNHDRPVNGTVIFGPNFNGTCFILYNNLLYYCLPKQPEYWPTTYYIEVSQPQFILKAGCFYNGQPYVATKNEIFIIQGTGHNSFFPHRMSALTGAQNADSMLAIAGLGILHVGTDGVYLFDGIADRKMSFAWFEPLFRGETVNGMPGVSSLVNSWLIEYKGQVYFGYASSGYAYPTNVIVVNLENKRASYYTYDNEIRTVTVDETNERLLAGDNSGYIWELEDQNEADDSGTAISWEIESKEFTLQTRAHFPRWAKYDVDASDNGCSASGTVLLDGVSHQTHTLTGNRSTKRRLVTTGNGERLSHRISGSGPVSVYGVESE